MGPWGMVIGLPLSMWWCLRQYYRARGKGYYPALAATLVFCGMTAAFVAVIAGVVLLSSSTWSDTAIDMAMLLLFPVSALVVTALVALLPHRPHRAGPRRSSFLSSRVPGVVLWGAFLAAIFGCIISLVPDVGFVIGIWPQPESGNLSSGLRRVVIPILGFIMSGLVFARVRLGAPGLADIVAADARPAVLYLRAFRQESDPFVWVWSREEQSLYTQRVYGMPMVTFEQYLGAEFARQLGPFVALGNPLDSVPPEGAARSYAPDEDWQRHFCALAGAAAAIVMDGSHSDNLRWELAEITRNGWQRKLFFLTAPPPRGRAISRLVYVLWCSAKGMQIPHWERFAAELKEAGLHVPPIEPDPGSVVAFDAAGRAEVLIRGAQQPEEFVTAVRTHL